MLLEKDSTYTSNFHQQEDLEHHLSEMKSHLEYLAFSLHETSIALKSFLHHLEQFRRVRYEGK